MTNGSPVPTSFLWMYVCLTRSSRTVATIALSTSSNVTKWFSLRTRTSMSVLGINNSIVTAIPMDVWISSLMSSRPELTVRTMREGSLRATRKEKKKKRLNLNPEASFIVPKVSHLSQAVLELKEGYCFRSAATGHGCTKR